MLDPVWSQIRSAWRRPLRGPRRHPVTPLADAILCGHGDGALTRAALERLAIGLRDRGWRCVVWTDAGRSYYFPAEVAGDERLARQALEAIDRPSFSCGRSLAFIGYAFWLTGLVIARMWLKRCDEIADLRARPALLWAALIDSQFHLARARRVWFQLGPRFLLSTHERYRPASALTLARPRGTEAVLYHHGLLGEYDRPLLADRVLAWNATDAGELGRAFAGARVTVVGNWEVDLARADAGASSQAPELILLSQCLPGEPIFEQATDEILGWLEAVGLSALPWRFRIKTRGPGDPILALVAARGLGKWLTPVEPGVSLAALLARSEVRAVAALSSSGLYVAAGAGKAALRLLASRWRPPMPVIDEVSVAIRNGERWREWLRGTGVPGKRREVFPEAALESTLRFLVDTTYQKG